jgi:Domain of unknown function (DUF6265)
MNLSVRLPQLLPFLAFLFTQTAIAQQSTSLKWIVGTWRIATPNGTVIEKWKVANDSTFTGKSFFVKTNGDSIPQETIELRLRKGEWAYVPTVQGQNNNQPTIFKVVFMGKEEFISTNPTHDFPQRIAYRRVKNQLFASIEGSGKGKYGKQNFDFQGD